MPSDLAVPLGGPVFLLISALAILAALLTSLAPICDPETRGFEDKLKQLFMYIFSTFSFLPIGKKALVYLGAGRRR